MGSDLLIGAPSADRDTRAARRPDAQLRCSRWARRRRARRPSSSRALRRARHAEIAVIDEFGETASGEGELGALDAPSFLANLLEWVVASYLRAFDEIEAELEKFDVEALTAPSRDLDVQIKLLIEAPSA